MSETNETNKTNDNPRINGVVKRLKWEGTIEEDFFITAKIFEDLPMTKPKQQPKNILKT